MTPDDEKDPPVPADLDGAPQRIRYNQDAKERDANDHAAPAAEPTD